MPGRYYEQFVEGETIEHSQTHTITQEENAAFCRMTLNNQPLHLDPEAARKGPFGKLLVNGLLTFSLAVGISVEELTAGTLIANLAYEDVEHPAPVFPGDTIHARSKVLEKRRTSKKERGLVKVETVAAKQDDTVVCRYRRIILVEVNNPEKEVDA